MQTILEIENVKKKYEKTQVLNGISLKVEEGEIISVLGPSGCGKSTLLRIIAGILPLDGGVVRIRGQEVSGPHYSLPVEKRGINMVFQDFALWPHMKVEDNITYGLKIQKVDREESRRRVEEIVGLLHLDGLLGRYPAELSGGQQQRVALARAIVTKPKVLLLDEPLSAIDAKLRKSLQIEIRRIQKELNITTIFVTHDQDEAMIMSDRICLLNEGRIEQLGKPIEIYTDPKTRFAAGFIGNYNVLGPAEFRLLTGLTPAAGDSIAIRPETIAISREKQNPAGSYEWEGTVLESRSRGNVLRYTILVNGIRIYADTLFRSFSIFEDGAKVYLSVEKRNCLPVADQASGAA